MTLDGLFSQELREYIIKATSQESALLKNLRKETVQSIGGESMLTGPVEGKLLQILIKLQRAKNCLEVGTFTGYSALNIASALPSDGKLITLELREKNAEFAKRYFAKVPYGHKISLLLGDATKTIQTLKQEFDFIFLDADKANYPVYYDLLIPKLRSGGLMVIDNALWGANVINPKDKETQAIHSLNMKATQDDKVETVMLSVRDGILLIRKF